MGLRIAAARLASVGGTLSREKPSGRPSVVRKRAAGSGEASRTHRACPSRLGTACTTAHEADQGRELAPEARLSTARRLREAIQLSGGFHFLVADLSGNPILAAAVRLLVARRSLVIAVFDNRGGLACWHDDHADFVELVRRRRHRAAAALRGITSSGSSGTSGSIARGTARSTCEPHWHGLPHDHPESAARRSFTFRPRCRRSGPFALAAGHALLRSAAKPWPFAGQG